jgi:hypothetical protein
MFLWYPVLDLARAPRRTARKKGSGYENGFDCNTPHLHPVLNESKKTSWHRTGLFLSVKCLSLGNIRNTKNYGKPFRPKEYRVPKRYRVAKIVYRVALKHQNDTENRGKTSQLLHFQKYQYSPHEVSRGQNRYVRFPYWFSGDCVRTDFVVNSRHFILSHLDMIFLEN